jgi:hypothetical protein
LTEGAGEVHPRSVASDERSGDALRRQANLWLGGGAAVCVLSFALGWSAASYPALRVSGLVGLFALLFGFERSRGARIRARARDEGVGEREVDRW